MEEEEQYQEERENMVKRQLLWRGIHDQRVLDAMRRVPRHLFVPPEMRSRAYYDGPLPIGLGQTISQPYIVAVMSELLELRGDETVFEVGTGSGYQAAVLGELAATVHTVERHAELARRAAELLERLGYKNIFIHTGDGTLGWLPGAPYQAIIVTAAAPYLSSAWVDQMDEGAILVTPVGGQGEQNLERWRKQRGEMVREVLFPVAFVPLRGKHGWPEEA